MGATAVMVDQSNRLTALERTPYDSESLLRRLLSNHRDLLRCITADDGRLLLLKPEAAVPDADGGSHRWLLDHLFVDCEGVPVLVEVKRASDTRARREVVAQMLDYAAHGTAYWPIESLIAAYEASTPDHAALLADFLGEREPDAFWRALEANLRAGRIRMVFVADRIPTELRRIVEFLNEQMRPAEVLAVEVEQHATSDDLRLLTPTLVGATERATAAKAVRGGQLPPMIEEAWFHALETKHGADDAQVARRMADWFRDNGFRVGVSASTDSLHASVERSGRKNAWPFFIRRGTGKLETNLRWLKSSEAYAADDARAALLARLLELPGMQMASDKLTGVPAIPVSALKSGSAWRGFTAIAIEVRDNLAA